MSSAEYLRGLINERLSAAAEEIFGAFKGIIIKYEDEIDCQRRMHECFWKPEIKLHRTEPPQQQVCKEEEILADQELCHQERDSSMDQEDSEPPQMKEDKEKELCIIQEGEQVVLKQETDTFMLTPTNEETDHSEDLTLFLNPDETVSAAQKESVVNMPVITSVVGEPNSDLQLLSVCKEEVLADQQLCHQEMESRMDQVDPEPLQMKEEKEELCISQGEEQLVLKQGTDPFILTPTNEENDHSEDLTLFLNLEETLSAAQKESVVSLLVKTSVVGEPNSDLQLLSNNSHVAENQDQKGDACEKSLSKMSTGEKRHVCKVCGKGFTHKSHLTVHVIIHTGEKPFVCKVCGKGFTQKTHLTIHMRIHTGERPYVCKTCGKGFRQSSDMKTHMRIHTGEKPCLCKTCGKGFRKNSDMKTHMRIHTVEKPFLCKTCGETFRHNNRLTEHMRIHTGDKTHVCNICGKEFTWKYCLSAHMKHHC